MKAYHYTQYGAPEVVHLVHVDRPTPKPNEILIRVHATTVSSGDWRARSLSLPKGFGLIGRLIFGVFGPRNPVLGTDLAGVVEAVGTDVTRYQVGDRVIGFRGAKMGSHAEYVTMAEDAAVVLMPEGLAFDEAAALPFGGTTAYDFLINKARLRAGERVLVNGATGAVGSAVVQLAKHFGAEVTAVCSASSADLARELGADVVIDYAAEDFTRSLKRYDMIVDTFGTAPWVRARHVLDDEGRLVIISGSLVDMLFAPLRARLAGKRAVVGVASEAPEVLEAVVDLAEEGAFRPVVGRRFGFDAMVAAHAEVETGHKQGSVVVTMAA